MRSQQSINKKQSLPGNSFQSHPSEFSNVPIGYCFKFHKGGHCARCPFKHSCPKCDGAHRMSICTFLRHSKQLPRSTTNAKSSWAKSSTPNANKVQVLNLSSGYNHSTVTFLSNGFARGFSLHFQGIRESSQNKNLLSVIQNPTVVDAKIANELAAGRLAGPFVSPPMSPFIVSPLGVVPKKPPEEIRLTHHLSFPKGASVNDGISHEKSTVCYATFGDAIRCMNGP